tara:strand:- start:348 stop:479 length:132 start_codon:yes stop_codon:yes gene_type:complete
MLLTVELSQERLHFCSVIANQVIELQTNLPERALPRNRLHRIV